MPSLTILGTPHQYDWIDSGTDSPAPVLVFVHGWLLSRAYWQPLITLLSSNYACCCYDLRGFGESQRDEYSSDAGSPTSDRLASYTLEAYAKDLERLLEQLDIERAWLIGHSLGGSIALWTAHHCPERVKGVICLNAGGGIYLKEEFERFRSVGQRIVQNRPPWLTTVPFLDAFFAQMMVDRPLDRQWGKQRLLDFVRADRDAALGTLLDSTTETEVHLLPQIVSQLRQPVYFISGRQDRVMEPKYVNYLASFHPLFGHEGGNVFEISSCGHLAMLEHPTIVARYLREILQSHSTEQAQPERQLF
jgi:pimeloyl-ACP methyl ester carboxylesterase